MRPELVHVVFGAMNEARLAPAHEVEAERVEPGRGHDAAVVPQATLAIEHWRVQPAVVGAEASGPQHSADAVRLEVDEEPGVLGRLGRGEPLGGGNLGGEYFAAASFGSPSRG